MSLIEWKDNFALGVPAVDHEHREMIELINELYSNLQQGTGKTTVIDFLGEIYARIAAHFALEEKMMREQGYDEYSEHKDEHERLLDEIRDLMDEYEDDSRFDENDLSRRLSDWFTVHFKTKDARLHRHLK